MLRPEWREGLTRMGGRLDAGAGAGRRWAGWQWPKRIWYADDDDAPTHQPGGGTSAPPAPQTHRCGEYFHSREAPGSARRGAKRTKGQFVTAECTVSEREGA